MSVTKHRFTVEEYHKMVEAGIFGEDDRVELIRGEIVEMAAIGKRHVECVIRLNRLLNEWILIQRPPGFEDAAVSVQNPVILSEYGEPQPDLVLINRSRGREGVPEPEDVVLVIEVADISLSYDREEKLPLYGDAGIPEVWIADVNSGIVEVHTDPRSSGYGSTSYARNAEEIPSLIVEGITADQALGSI